MSTFDLEVKQGKRFRFGRNWRAFLSTLSEERIQIAEKSLMTMLGESELHGKSFLDIGSGSGIWSLAARNQGANVVSLDFDPDSVGCTSELRERFHADDPDWVIHEGSVLDNDFMNSLGVFDIVYSWGVLHHTGNMWEAIDNAVSKVKPGGLFFVALYNDQGRKSIYWKKVKQVYCSGILGKLLVSSIYVPAYFFRACVASILKFENVFAKYKKNRGMSMFYDWIDWLGGLPFEVASVDEVFQFMRNRQFQLQNIRSTNSLGNNEFVFVHEPKN